MGKKYKTEKDPETGLLRIIALKDFLGIKKGEKGGLIEKESNLSQEGNCWVSYYARVCGDAKVYDNARIAGMAEVGGKARIFGNALVYGLAEVYGSAKVYEEVEVYGRTKIYGNAQVYGGVDVFDDVCVAGNAKVYGNASVFGTANICGNVKLHFTRPTVIAISIQNNKDYIILAINKKDFDIIPLSSNIEEGIEENYIKNIQTIRQLYGEEI